MSSNSAPDPVEVELFRHLLLSIPAEMSIVLRNTAYSANIKERRDFSCALYDAQGGTIAMGEGMPVHLGAMPLSLHAVREVIDLQPGDVAIVNDPFAGGTHLPDITAVCGVWTRRAAKPDFFLANRAHHADVGGMTPGSMPLATEIYQEGIRIPPVLLVKKGRLDRQILRLILANVRTPEEREGDLLAQWMSLERGRKRLLDLVAGRGLEAVRRNAAFLCDYSERLVRDTLSRIPDGDYTFEDQLDDDGAGSPPVPVRVTIRIRQDEAEVDFTGSAPQTPGPMNANYAICLAATLYVFRCLLREDAPANAGTLRPIRVIAPNGTVVNARPPAAMAAGNVETSQRITDVLLGALASALPGHIPAASQGTMNNLSFGGWDATRSRAFAYYETIAGGQGASAHGPGASGMHSHMTNSWNTPVEALEHQYPLRVAKLRLNRGSGGAGQFPGGDGILKEIEFLTDCRVSLLTDRRIGRPYGVANGESAQPGRNRFRSGGKWSDVAAKSEFRVRSGDRIRIETPGGGGYGNPQSKAAEHNRR